MMQPAPTLDSITTVRAKIGTELRALETERTTLEERLAAVRGEIAVREAVRDVVMPKAIAANEHTLTIPKRGVR